MSLAIKVLLALVLGLAAGLAATHVGQSADALVGVLQPVGTLWVASIRMAIIPFVVASLLVGVGGAADTRAITALGARGFGLFVILLSITGVFSMAVGPAIFGMLHIDPVAAEALRAGAGDAGATMVESARQLPSIAQWLTDLVPVNPIKAAADGALLPLIVFSIAMGAAVTRVEKRYRDALLDAMRAVQDASLAIMRFALALAPAGVFALAFALAARVGLSAAGALATYMGVVALICTAFCLLILYPLAAWFGGVSILTFARALLPAQAVAFSTRSSLAAYPAMIEAARTKLGLSEPVIDFLMPVMIAMFRVGAVVGMIAGATFVAALYAIPLGPMQYLTLGVISVATSFSVPGIPAGAIIMMVPALLAIGLPAEGVGVLLAVDTIPDMFRTVANVTADFTVAVVLDRPEAAR